MPAHGEQHQPTHRRQQEHRWPRKRCITRTAMAAASTGVTRTATATASMFRRSRALTAATEPPLAAEAAGAAGTSPARRRRRVGGEGVAPPERPRRRDAPLMTASSSVRTEGASVQGSRAGRSDQPKSAARPAASAALVRRWAPNSSASELEGGAESGRREGAPMATSERPSSARKGEEDADLDGRIWRR